MPQFTVTDPQSGRSVTLEGDSAPNEQELEQVFSSIPAQSAPAPEQNLGYSFNRKTAEMRPILASPELSNNQPSEARVTDAILGQQPAAQEQPTQQAAGPIDYNRSFQSSTAQSSLTGGNASEAPPTFNPYAQEQTVRGLQQTAKYAPPLIAGIMTGGASVPIQMAATGIAGAAGSVASQSIGDATISGREIAASGLESAVPIFRFAPITPFMSTAKAVGLAGARATATGLTAGALTEGANMIRPDYVAPKDTGEAMRRLFNPAAAIGVGFSTVGSLAERVAGRGAAASAVRAERGVTGPNTAANPSPSIMLTDVLPDYAPLEARSIIAKNPRALTALRDLTVDIDQTILQQFADAPNASKIASDIAPAVGKLKQLKNNAIVADQEALKASNEYQQAVSTGRFDIADLKKKAEELSFKASQQEALMNEGIDKWIGLKKPSLAALSPEQNTAQLTKLLDDTFKVQGNALGSLYEKAGVGLNDAVVDRATLVNAINRRAADPQSMLRGNEAKRAVLEQIDTLFSGAPTLTLEQFRNARNAIATGLGDSPLFSSSAEKLAGDTYSAFRDATDEFIRKSSPDKFPAWKDANKAASSWYQARDSAFIRDFVDPATDTLRQGKAAEFVNALAAGKTEGFIDLEKLAASIAGTGEPAAIAGAEQFKKGVSQYIATGILDNAVVNRGTALSSEAAVFDPRKLYTTLNKLQSQKFPVESLGMGSAKDINALAKIAGGSSVTRPELEEFFKNVGSLGGDVAAARIQYRRQVVSNLLELGSDTKVDRIRKTQALARKARIDATTAQRELAAAKNDPLVMAFGEGTFGLSADPTIPGREGWVASIRTLPAKQAKALVDSLPPANRAEFRARTAADILAQYSNVTPGVTPRADVASIGDFFFSQSMKNERDTVRAIMDTEYAKFQEIGRKLEPILKTQYLLQRGAELSRAGSNDLVKGVAAGSGFLSGQLATGQVAAQGIGNIQKLLDRGQYNLMYQLYINPTLAPKFARAGYNMEKFANESGLHRVAIQMAEKQDEDRKAAQKPK